MRIDVAAPSGSGINTISYGIRGGTEATYAGYGKTGDAFVYASSDTNGFNIINQFYPNRENYIRFYAGKDTNGTIPDIHIQGSGSNKGYVGINKPNPQTTLHVGGTITIDPYTSAPTPPGVEGQMVPVNISGTCYLYVFIGGTWKSTLLT